jgi:hypothetical protein
VGVPIRRRLRSGRRRDLSALVITSLVRAASGHPVIPGLAPSRSFPASLLPSRRMPGSRAGFSSFGVARRPRCDRPHPTVISAGAGILAVVFGGPSSCPPDRGPPDSTPGRPGECRDLPADDLSVIPADVGMSAAGEACVISADAGISELAGRVIHSEKEHQISLWITVHVFETVRGGG